MTEKKRKRGRPKLPTPITEDYASSRRQAVNAMYMYEAVDLITAAAAEIPNGDALWFADDRTRTAASKNGVLEQIGRMRVQDGFSDGDCIYIANLAADAVNGGFTSREVERTIRAIRLAFKAKDAHTDDPYYADLAARAVDMMDEVMDKIRAFAEKYTIAPTNGRELSVDLGEICHYMTDFFTYPHNDDIYTHNLFAHYVYEKRVAFVIRRRMTEAKFEQWVSPIIPPTSVDALLNRITDMHDAYRAAGRHHGIDDDLVHICRATATVVLSIISIVYEQVEETAPALA